MTNHEEKHIEEIINKYLDDQKTTWSRMDDLDWLHYKRVWAEKQLTASKKRLTKTFNHLRSKEVPASLWGKGLYWAERGLNMAEGATIGYKIGDAINIIMGIRKKIKKN